jgi:hypothetical protein
MFGGIEGYTAMLMHEYTGSPKKRRCTTRNASGSRVSRIAMEIVAEKAVRVIKKADPIVPHQSR